MRKHNYAGKSSLCIETSNGSVFWSFDTIVGFSHPTLGLVVSVNRWNNTTGKHLNAIDGGGKEAQAKRVSREAFNAMLLDSGL